MSKNKRHLIKTCGTLDLTSVKEGENLLAWDFEKAEQTLNRINKVDRQVIAGNWYLLNEQVLLFENQSIFVNGKVTHAKLLKLGDELVGTNGNVVVVNSLKRIIGKHTFYRFEIDGNHSFFVNGILLHNASRYWVGAGGYWTSAANWSATDGGAGGAGSRAPGRHDLERARGIAEESGGHAQGLRLRHSTPDGVPLPPRSRQPGRVRQPPLG